MIKKKYILWVLFTLILFSVVNINATTFGTFKPNQNVSIVQLGNGFTSCNITSVAYPNGTTFVQDVIMTKRGDEYNYTLDSSDIVTDGIYVVRGICGSVVWAGDFEVNPQGIVPSEQRTQSTTRAIYFLFGIGILLFIGFLFVSGSAPIKLTFLVFSVIFMVAALNIISITLTDEVVNPALESFFDGITAISFIFYWFAAGLLIIMWFFTMLNTWIFKKNMENINRFGG